MSATRPDEERDERLYLALRERSPEGAPWPHRATLEFDGFEPLQRAPGWAERAALGLFASLTPEQPPPSQGRIVRAASHEMLYGFGQDCLWAAREGAVLCALDCFGGNAGGIDAVWSVHPTLDRRALFRVGEDYSQSRLQVHLGAETADALASLRAQVEPYFVALGLTAVAAQAAGEPAGR